MQGLFIALFWVSLLGFFSSFVLIVLSMLKKTGKTKKYAWFLAGSVVGFFISIAGVEPVEKGTVTVSNEQTSQIEVQPFREQLLALTAKADALWEEFEKHLAEVESGTAAAEVLEGYKDALTAVSDDIFALPVDESLSSEERQAMERLKDTLASAYFELAKAAGYYESYHSGSQEALQLAKERVQHFDKEIDEAKSLLNELEN